MATPLGVRFESLDSPDAGQTNNPQAQGQPKPQPALHADAESPRLAPLPR